MRILLAEDDPLLGDGLRAGLRQQGFQVDWVRDGAAAERELRAQPYAAAVLDLGLPLKDGLDVIAALRRAGAALPVLVLTARDAIADRVRGLDIGADDYVVKPVDLDELAARLRALVRRAHGQPQEVLSAQHVVLDPAARRVTCNGQEVALAGREFDLLHALMLNAERVMSREQLEQHLYSWGQEVESNAIEVHVHHLRRKLGALWGTLWPLALALPLLALLAWWSIRQGLKPLRSLGEQLAGRAPSALTPVGLPDPPPEVAPLMRALNGLFSRIESMMQSERRFTGDAAHELRTPIAAIRTQAQVALAEANDTRRQHALRATLEGCDRATRLVDQLLTLSRLEGGAAVPMKPVDLSAVARQVVRELAPRALRKQQDLGLDASDVCMIDGDEMLLGVLLRNLVDNAVRYCPAGARINVTTRVSGGCAVPTIEDSGPGMSERDVAGLGHRFARGSGHGESGSGLGWSIVCRIAQVHGLATAVTRSLQLGGLAVMVKGPTGAMAGTNAVVQ